MRIEASALLPGTPLACFTIMVDPRFQEEKIEHTGAIDGSSTISRAGDETIIRTERAFSTDGLPDVVQRLAGRRLVVVESQVWSPPHPDGGRAGRVELHIVHQPLVLTGALALRMAPDGTFSSVAGELKARVPLIGGKFESAAAPIVRAGANAEYELLATWLHHP